MEKEASTNYLKYRGKCREMSEEAVSKDPTLTLVRGHYYCPIWNSNEAHWWTVRDDGTIYDPTKDQFPSAGLGTYTTFNGIIECAQCGKEVLEKDARGEGNYGFCSYECHGRFIGVF